jgi:hypothetical protein
MERIVAECAVVMVDCRMIDHFVTLRDVNRRVETMSVSGTIMAAVKPAGCQMIDCSHRIQRRELGNRSAAAESLL